ncbi:hypothetical protein VQ056_22420 [Paenibacillus sp. JTLBN-2024]
MIRFEKEPAAWGLLLTSRAGLPHEIVTQALTMLENMEHRGGQGNEPDSGDGAGIMLQIPHRFFAEEAQKQGFRASGARSNTEQACCFYPMMRPFVRLMRAG